MECVICGVYLDDETVEDVNTEWFGNDWLQVVITCECGAEYSHDLQLEHFELM